MSPDMFRSTHIRGQQTASKLNSFTWKQKQVLILAFLGYTQKESAHILNISMAAVTKRVMGILNKTKARSMTQAVFIVMQWRIQELEAVMSVDKE